MFNPISISAANPGPMTGAGNQTYLLVSSRGEATLIDAGVGAIAHLEALDRELHTLNARLVQAIVTHAHADHIAGAPAVAARHAAALWFKAPWPSEDAKYAVAWQPLADDTAIAAGDASLIALHTPGHSPDHVVLWHEESRTMFSGDLVTLGASVVIQASRGGNMRQYLQALERLRNLHPARLLPAHGQVIDDPDAVLRGYIDHRMAREAQIIAALHAGVRTVPAIAESIYDDLSPPLEAAARENVRAHLERLREEGRVAVSDDLEFTLI